MLAFHKRMFSKASAECVRQTRGEADCSYQFFAGQQKNLQGGDISRSLLRISHRRSIQEKGGERKTLPYANGHYGCAVTR